jgi:hypothetical protein
MKDSIIDYIERLETRVKILEGMFKEATDHQTKVRLDTKKSVYKDIIVELKRLVEDDQDTA